jgi:hypothetical protein
MSLSKRLNALKTGSYGDPLAEFRGMPWEVMCNQKVDFGKAHLGKSYLTTWHQEPSWVRWVVKTYEGSQKIEHQKFMVFVELMVQMEEQGAIPTSIEINTSPHMEQPPVIAKAKARPKSQPQQADLFTHLSEEDVEEWMEMPPNENTEMINALQARMGFLENAMTEVLNHIRQEQK